MDKIQAKPISNDYWILRKDDKKIGQLIYSPNGYSIKLKGYDEYYVSSLNKLKEVADIEFFKLPVKQEQYLTREVHSFPTDTLSYNSVYNAHYKLPLYTKEQNSKSWYAAGYYIILINQVPTTTFCPKLITLRRNNYSGPYKTEKCEK